MLPGGPQYTQPAMPAMLHPKTERISPKINLQVSNIYIYIIYEMSFLLVMAPFFHSIYSTEKNPRFSCVYPRFPSTPVTVWTGWPPWKSESPCTRQISRSRLRTYQKLRITPGLRRWICPNLWNSPRKMMRKHLNWGGTQCSDKISQMWGSVSNFCLVCLLCH